MVSRQWSVISWLKFTVLIIFLSVNVFTSACNNAPPPRQNFVIAESKSYEASIFRQHCAICHGQEANGKEIDGKLIPSLRYGDAAKKSEQEIYDQIANGKLPMPSFKNQLTEDEIRKMVKFIMHDLQGRQ